jgi:hypothetical protein
VFIVSTHIRLTVLGADGTGKNFAIDTLPSLIRRMFQHTNPVHVLAPTCIADFNIKGEKLHSFFGLDIHDLYRELPTKIRDKMIAKVAEQ